VSANAHALARYVDGSHTIEALRRGHRGRSSRTLRNLINSLMKSVGEHGEFRIELGGVLHYGTYMVTKPGEIVEVRVAPLKKRLRKSLCDVAARGARAAAGDAVDWLSPAIRPTCTQTACVRSDRA
jgi:hypothetical protein